MSVSRISQAYPDRVELRGTARPLDDEVVGVFAPAVSGHMLVQPRAAGTKQEPPLPWGSLRGSDHKSTLVQH